MRVSTLAIRAAIPQDLGALASFGAEIVRLHHATNPKRFFLPEDVESGYVWSLSQELNRREATVLVAEKSGDVVGYAYGTIEAPDDNILIDQHGVIQDICVAQTVRHSGVGRALVLELVTRLEALGAPRILVRSMVGNEPARRLFASLGFVPTLIEMTRERGDTKCSRGQ